MMELERLFKIQAEMEPSEFREALGLKSVEEKQLSLFKMAEEEKEVKFFRLPEDDGRIFSNYFANVIVSEKNERVIQPMRYRIRPHDSKEEVPAKYNVFNARIDSLEIRDTWKPLFMRNHGIIPFTNFYEWVLGPNNKPKLITFFPEGREIMWAPCLWDEWISKDGSIHFKSFAIITDEPPQEILRMGHDRCPIFLSEEHIEKWLTPHQQNKMDYYQMLKMREDVKYSYNWFETSVGKIKNLSRHR